MTDREGLERTAAELCAEFDRSFASPWSEASVERQDFLLVRLGAAPYALHLRQISALVAGRAIARVPARARGLLGLAGIRGEIVSVFDLAALMGHESDVGGSPWMVLCGAGELLAFAISAYEGHLRADRASIHKANPAASARHQLDEVAMTASGARPIVDLNRIIDSIRSQTAISQKKGESIP